VKAFGEWAAINSTPNSHSARPNCVPVLCAGPGGPLAPPASRLLLGESPLQHRVDHMDSPQLLGNHHHSILSNHPALLLTESGQSILTKRTFLLWQNRHYDLRLQASAAMSCSRNCFTQYIIETLRYGRPRTGLDIFRFNRLSRNHLPEKRCHALNIGSYKTFY